MSEPTANAPAAALETGAAEPHQWDALMWAARYALDGGAPPSPAAREWAREAMHAIHAQRIARYAASAAGPGARTGEAEALARRFHETYERLAPSFGYETRRESAKPWSDVPEQNRRLMVAVCAEILATPRAAPAGAEGEAFWAAVEKDFASVRPPAPPSAGREGEG